MRLLQFLVKTQRPVAFCATAGSVLRIMDEIGTSLHRFLCVCLASPKGITKPINAERQSANGLRLDDL